MAYTLTQSADYASSAKATSHSVTWPGATATGALLILFVDFNEEAVLTTVTPPAGWSTAIGPVEHQSTANPQIKGAVYYKQNAASTSGSVTVTLDQSRHCRLHIHEWAGGATTGVLDVTATNHGSSTTLDSGTSATTTNANELWVGLLACKNVNAQTIVASTGWTQVSEVGQSTGAGAAGRSGVYRKIASATGASNIQATISVSADWVGMTVTFNQAAAAGSAVQLTATGSTTNSTLLGGVGNRTNSNNSDLAASMAKYPNIKLACFYVGWATLEPNAPTSINVSSGMNWANFEAAIENSVTYNKRILLRIECGYRSPAWLYTTSVQPVTKVFLVDENGNNSTGASPNNVYIPLPWTSSGSGTPNVNLVAHYTRLLKEVQKEMIKPDGHGGLIGDHVYFMAVSMPTWVGTEMSMGYQSSTAFTGTYDGPSANVSGSPTYKSINTAEWNNYGTEVNRRVWFLDAWDKAAQLHMTYLTAVPSSIAYGTSFGAYTDQKNRAAALVASYGQRICHMTTDLKVSTVGGTYAEADAPGAATIASAKAAGGWVGFQSATESKYPSPFTDAVKSATDDGLNTYGMTFFEPADPLLGDVYNASGSWGGIEDLQTRILAQGGGTPGGGMTAKITTSPALLSVQSASAIPNAYDRFTRSVGAGGLGTPDVGGAYTLTGTAADFSVNGSQAVVAVTAANQTKTATLAGVMIDDVWLSAQFQTDTLPAGSYTAFDLLARRVDASNMYRVRAFLQTNGAVTVQVSTIVAGVATVLNTAASTGLTVQTGTDYTLLAGLVGTNPTDISVYLWDSSAPPPYPVPFQVQLTDTTAALQVSAPVALQGFLNTGSTATATKIKVEEWYAVPNRFVSADTMISVATSDAQMTFSKPPPLSITTGSGKGWTPVS